MSYASIYAPGSVEELQEFVRRAAGSGEPIEPIGGGTQAHIGYAPQRALTPVSTTALRQVVDYTPADLVVVAQAGMTVDELRRTVEAEGQSLPLDVALPDRQTLGGIVATRAANMTRGGNGSVRDWLIGCHVIGGDGQLVVGGGKVVKNVAGYDLPKLYCGSWGTLGLITQVAFRLAPMPQARRTLLVTLSGERNSEEALDGLHRSLTPTFSFLLNADSAAALLGENAPAAQFMVIGFDGREAAVNSLIEQAKTALAEYAFQVLELPGEVAGKLREMLRDLPAAEAPLTIRCNILPSQVGAFARMIEWTARRAGFTAQVWADTGVGTVGAHIRPRDDDEAADDAAATDARWMRLYPDLKDKIDRVGGSAVYERMPQVWRDNGYPVWTPILADTAWMRKLKAILDPQNIFRPGCFIDQI